MHQTVPPRRGDAFPRHDLFQCCGISNNANNVVIDLDPINDRAEIGLSERNLAIGDVFAHCLPEPLDHFRGNFSCRNRLSPDAIKCRLCPLGRSERVFWLQSKRAGQGRWV